MIWLITHSYLFNVINRIFISMLFTQLYDTIIISIKNVVVELFEKKSIHFFKPFLCFVSAQ
jgi:hypothetical protein